MRGGSSGARLHPGEFVILKPFDPWRSPLCTCPMKWVLHPYTGCSHMCLYCYAASYIPAHNSVRVKRGVAFKISRDAVRLPPGTLVQLSSSSDPYTRPEDELGVSREAIRVLLEAGARVLVVTKSSLVLRDLDLLAKRRDRVAVAITITTLDKRKAAIMEPGAPPPDERLLAVKRLAEEGLNVVVRIDPVIPFVNDSYEELQRLVEGVARAGAKQVVSSTLKLNFRIAPKVIEGLAKLYSDKADEVVKALKELYWSPHSEIIRGYRYMPRERRLEYMAMVKEIAEKEGLAFTTCREGLSHLNTPGFFCDGSSFLFSERPPESSF